jgi:metal-responsive CopG/Arc/MetJ family transcriptional regulator
MSEQAQAIGIRLDNKMRSKVETVSKEESLDRSMAIRLLLEEGYGSYSKRKAAEEYKTGKTTISKAAQKANLTIWEMEQYLICQGYKSQYSADDLKQELEAITKKQK